MDFQTLKRRDLQALCKLNNIPANLTNAAMVDALRSLPTVNGIEDLLEQLQTGVTESPLVSGTSTRQKPTKEVLECSEVATRTRCGTRRVAIEGTDTRKTTTTATRNPTRRRAMQEPSIQDEMEKNMQAKFEEDLEQSDITVNSGIESAETSVEALKVCVDHILPRSQKELEHKCEEVNNDGEVVYVGDDKENMGTDHVVNEAQDEYIEMSNALQKLDFHCLGRKDLQNLCKKNKIPANMANAAMADALGSLDNVEGLEEFLEGYDPLAIKSPETSQRTSSRVCQSRTARKTTDKKSVRLSSALCKSMSRKMENLVLHSVTLTDEGCLEKSELDYVPENSSTINGESKPVSEEALNEHVTSTDVLVTGKELQEEMGENKCDGRGDEGTLTEICDTPDEIESNTDICSAVVLGQQFSIETGVKLQDDFSEIASDDQEVEVNEGTLTEIRDTSEEIESNANICSAVVLVQESNNLFDTGVELQHDASETASDDQEVEVYISESNIDEPNVDVDNCLMLQAPEADITELDEGIELTDKSVDIHTVESESLADSDELSDLEADNEEYADSESISNASVKEHEDDSEEPQFVFGTAAQAKATPLCQKSLRKLKKLVKEKIQETNLLANKLEKLTLQEVNKIPVDNNNSDIDVAKLDVKYLSEETKETDMTSNELDSTTVTVFEDDEESTEDLEMKARDVGELLSDNANNVPEEPLLTSRKVLKPLVFTTPSKSSSRILRVFDANKENIDDSATKTTETGTIKMTVTTHAKSIGKLKKEVKVLLQQSEKKRPALQSRSDNQCSLTSP